MALDTLIKKFFPVIIGIGLAVIAYFQASGIVELFAGSRLVPSHEELTGPSLRPAAKASRVVPPRKSAAALIAHNIFEHSVDLNPKPVVVEDAEEAVPEPTGMDDPLRAELCPGMVVEIVTESPDREWSIAVLKGPGDKAGI